MRETLLRPAPGKKDLDPALAGALVQAAAALARLVGQRAEERRHPGVALPRCVGAQRAVAGQRHGHAQQTLRHPEPHQGRADRRAGAATAVAIAASVATAASVAAEPGVQAGGGGEQRGGAGRRGLREDLFGALHVALLVEVRCHQPLVQVERVAGGGEDGAAVDGRRPPPGRGRRTGDRSLAPSPPCSKGFACVWTARSASDQALVGHPLLPAFLHRARLEAADGLDRLVAMERAWRAARRAVSGRRRNSRAAAAVDLLAAAPLLSATSLAAGLGMAVKNATLLLDDFCAAGIAIEVTHRSKRRLFGLTGLAPLRDVVRPPYRAEPGRGRGRPPLMAEEAITVPALPPVPPLDGQPFDYGDLAHWMTQMDQTIRQARRVLGALSARDSTPSEPSE